MRLNGGLPRGLLWDGWELRLSGLSVDNVYVILEMYRIHVIFGSMLMLIYTEHEARLRIAEIAI